MKTFTRILALVFGAAVLISACQPQQPQAQTQAPPPASTEAPTQVGATPTPNPALAPKLLWELKIDGALQASPVLVNDMVLVVPLDGKLLALNGQSGEILWRFSPDGSTLWERSLTADSEHVWVAGKDGNLYAINAQDGSQLWKRSFGISIQFPILATKDALYVGTTKLGTTMTADELKQGDATLWALNPMNGETLWSFKSTDYAFQTPFVKGDRIYVGGSFYYPAEKINEGGWIHVYALSAKDGNQIWKTTGKDGFIKSIYATDETVAYVAYTDFIVALSAQTGKETWRRDTGNWTPALVGSGQIIYSSAANTNVYVWQILDGSSLWEQNLGGGAFNYALGAPALLKDSVLVLSQRGDLYAFNRQNGVKLWSYSTGKMSQVGLAATEAGNLYFGDEKGNFYAYRIP
jgi:outer membrane protein assembly factor BamB